MPRLRRRCFARLAATAVLFAVAAVSPLEAQEMYDADQVKAAFLYHFGTYVQWPNPRDLGEAITIAVLGANPVAQQLSQFLPGRSIQGRRVEVRSLGGIEDLADEELLFIGSEHNGQLDELLRAVGERSVLVVTDADNGLDRGSMVNFQLVEQRVRFEISLRRAEDVGLMLSSRLLSAALRVETSWFVSLTPVFAAARSGAPVRTHV